MLDQRVLDNLFSQPCVGVVSGCDMVSKPLEEPFINVFQSCLDHLCMLPQAHQFLVPAIREKQTLNPFDNGILEGIHGVYPVTEVGFFIQGLVLLYGFDS